jgi:hypothetical protein
MAVKLFSENLLSLISPDFYRKGIEELASRWKKCIEIDEDYFD